MRVLSRSNVDYLNLILEDFEDHYNALVTVKKLSKNALESANNLFERSNPFNRSTLSRVFSTPNTSPSSFLNKANQRGKLLSGDYVQWLLSQNWEQLNVCLMNYYNINDKDSDIYSNE